MPNKQFIAILTLLLLTAFKLSPMIPVPVLKFYIASVFQLGGQS